MYTKFATVFVAIVTSQPHQGFTKDLTKVGVDGYSQGRTLKDVVRGNFQVNRERSSGSGEVGILRPDTEFKSSELQSNDDHGGVTIRDIEDLEKELNLASPDSDEGSLKHSNLGFSFNEETSAVDGDWDRRVIRIADYLSKEHLSIENFKPSVLRAIVQNPEALRILPREQIIKLTEDPIFQVSLPQEALAAISKVLLDKGDELVAELGAEADDYDEYGFDYSDYEDQLGAGVGDFLSDINPEFLSSVSSDLIVSYIEGLSPSELEEILNNSNLLRSLPPSTLGELLQKLPKDVILQVLNSKGVLELFENSDNNPKIVEIQNMLAPIIVKNLDADLLSSVPNPIIKAHLEIEPALIELFIQSEKLEMLIKKQPEILNEISFDFIAKIFKENPEVEKKIGDGVILSLLDASPLIINKFPVSFLINIARDRPWLVAQFPQETINTLANRHQVFFDLGDKDLMILLQYRPSILMILIDLPDEILVRFLHTRPNLLDILPDNAKPYLRQLVMAERFLSKLTPELLSVMSQHPVIRKMLNKYILITILRVHPTLPEFLEVEEIMEFLPLLEDAWFRARLPCLTISVMSEDVDFIKMVPTHILEVIVTSKRILSCVPARNLETLLSQQVGLSRVSLFSLMNAFTKMPRDKLSLKMMRLIIMEQAPDIAERMIFGE